MKTFKEFLGEDVPTNNASAGNVKGMGGASGEPGVKKKNPHGLIKLLRRLDPKKFTP